MNNSTPQNIRDAMKLAEEEPDGKAFNPLGEKNDPVSNPSHYNRGGIECVDFLKAFLTPEEFKGYCKGTVITYLARAPYKKQETQDIQKAAVYAKWLEDFTK